MKKYELTASGPCCLFKHELDIGSLILVLSLRYMTSLFESMLYLNIASAL